MSAQSGGVLGSVKTSDSKDLSRLCWLLSPQLSLLAPKGYLQVIMLSPPSFLSL